MNMMEQIWKIRDARGLDAYEKMFLMTVASRGEAGMYCEWKRNVEDMGIKKDRYYKSRASLLEKKLISAQEQAYGPTIYMIDEVGLDVWYTTYSATQNESFCHTENHSATQNGHSVTPERKKNTKKNNNINKKKNIDAPAGADTSELSLNESIKKDQEQDKALRAAPSLSSLIDSNLEDSLNDVIEEEGDAAAAPVVRQEEAKKVASTPAIITEWRKTDRESELNNFGLEANSGGFSVRQNKARAELTKIVEHETKMGRLRSEWNDELFDEALTLMLDSMGWHRTMTKMDSRAYNAYQEAGFVLEW